MALWFNRSGRKTKILKLAAILFVAFIMASVLLFLIREYISNYSVRLDLNDIEMPGPGSRVLVFSPHNDDEVLGAGELIKRTIKNGGQVRVALVTNGDGFKSAIEFDYFKLNLRPADYINFGYKRQKESINALRLLGLPEKDIIFLGYPDGGISYLWNLYWDNSNPFKSRRTMTSKSPYRNSYTAGAPYTGQSLVADITRLISEYRPTHIVFPHPNDRHPDHWATNAFVKYVLTVMNYQPVKEWLYLVHRGDWPTPMKKAYNMYLVPPAKLLNTGTQWYTLDMDSGDEMNKARAIRLYKTQLRLLGFLMAAFERKNEMFGEYGNVKIVQNERYDRDVAPFAGNRVIVDPLQDAINLQILKGADITGVYAEISKDDNLHVFVETDMKMEKYVRYCFNMIFISDGKVSRLNLEVRDGKILTRRVSSQSITDIGGIVSKTNGKIIHVIIPSKISGNRYRHIYINAYTSLEGHLLDKTAWRMLDRQT